MDKEKMVFIFNNLLEEWHKSEITVIYETSINIEEDEKKFEERKEKYRKEFLKALGE